MSAEPLGNDAAPASSVAAAGTEPPSVDASGSVPSLPPPPWEADRNAAREVVTRFAREYLDAEGTAEGPPDPHALRDHLKDRAAEGGYTDYAETYLPSSMILEVVHEVLGVEQPTFVWAQTAGMLTASTSRAPGEQDEDVNVIDERHRKHVERRAALIATEEEARALARRFTAAGSLLSRVQVLVAERGSKSATSVESSWTPADVSEAVDALLEGRLRRRAPDLLTRVDGQALLYSGLLNGLHGPSESGKSWCALHACKQQIAEGAAVLYLDFESDRIDIVSRLIAIGARPDQVRALLTYIGPSEAYAPDEVDAIAHVLVDGGFALTVLDGVTDAMSAFGLSPRVEDDFAKFKRSILLPLTETGSALLTVDHQARNSDNNEALGTQHKRASVRGASFTVEVVEQFVPGKRGIARLVVSKDRPGGVRAASTQVGGASFVAGYLIIEPNEDAQAGAVVGAYTTRIVSNGDFLDQARDSLGPLSRTAEIDLIEKIKALVDLVKAKPGVTTNGLKPLLGKTPRTVTDEAIERGYIRREEGANKSLTHYWTGKEVRDEEPV